MKPVSKRLRRWITAVVSFLVFWAAYDIWDHSRHPVFWGLSYLIRVPVDRPHLERHGNRTEIDPWNMTKANWAKIRKLGFTVTDDGITNHVERRLRYDSEYYPSTNWIRRVDAWTNTSHAMRLSDGGSNYICIREVPDYGDIIRLSSNSLMVASYIYASGMGFTLWIETMTLDPSGGIIAQCDWRPVIDPFGRYSLQRDKAGLIRLTVETSDDTIYVAIDPELCKAAPLDYGTGIIDARHYDYCVLVWPVSGRTMECESFFIRDIPQLIAIAKLRAAERNLAIYSYIQDIVQHPTWYGWALLIGILQGMIAGAMALFSRPFRRWLRGRWLIMFAIGMPAFGCLVMAIWIQFL